MKNTAQADGKAKKARISKLSEEYLETRNRQMRAKAFMAETQANERRGELIERKLVLFQAGYLLSAMRQRILRLPQECIRQLNGLQAADIYRIKGTLEGIVHSALNEIADLPEKAIDPRWLETLEKNGEKPAGPPSAQDRPPAGQSEAEEGQEALAEVSQFGVHLEFFGGFLD